MNDEHRQILERLFDGEPLADDPRDAADDAESLAYLRHLGLLRELARRHDPAAAVPPRHPVAVPPRSRRRIVAVAAVVALAASALFVTLTLMIRHGRRTDPAPATDPAAPSRSDAGTSVAVAPAASPRSPRPPLEVELYRWANESAPCRDDAAGVVLSRVGPLQGRPASREILALELANATPGSAVKLPRSAASLVAVVPGSVRKPGSARRHRPSPGA